MSDISPPWRSALDRALAAAGADPAARFVQVATVRPDGRPANRTLVFRGFDGPASRPRFTADARSAKLEHLAHAPWAAACWYFAATREQFRLTGRLEVVTAGDDPGRAEVWRHLSEAARAQFGWPPPGTPRSPAIAFAGPAPDPDRPPVTFVLLVLDADEVDHLELLGDPQTRTRYSRSAGGAWRAEAVNP